MWTRSTMWRWTVGWTSRTGGLSGGSDPGRRDGVPAGGPDGAGPAQPGLGDPPGGEVSPGQAHAGRPREACDLSQTPVHGAPDPGPGPSGRGLAAVDPGRKKPVLDDKRNYFGIFHKDSRKAIEIARRNRYNIGYSMMPSWGILIFVRRNQEKPLLRANMRRK